MMEIVGIGKRDGSTIPVKVLYELAGDKKDFILRKTGQHKVTLFKIVKEG